MQTEPDLSVVPLFVRNRWEPEPNFEHPDGHVCLALSLYLAFAPTSEELRAALEVWRQWSDWTGPVRGGRYQRYGITETVDLDDEESWEPWFDTTPQDSRYGLVWIEGDGEDEDKERIFSIRVVAETQGEEGFAQAAPLCLVTLPFDTDPTRLPELARALLEVLPIRSGLGGFAARYGSYPTQCYRWCRQFPSLDLQDPDMVYPALREGVRGAGWLTVLGTALGRALADVGFSESVGVERLDNGALVLQVGPRPELWPITDGLPPGLVEIEGRLAPLKIGRPSWAPKARVFTQFEVTDKEYGPWLYRFFEPDRFLALSAWELHHLVEEMAPVANAEELLDLARIAGQTANDGTDDLGRTVHNAGCEAKRREMPEVARVLFETCLTMPDCIPQTYGNLMSTVVDLKAYEAAEAFFAAHQHRADPFVTVNAAGMWAERGEGSKALDLLELALEQGLDRPSVRDNPSFAGIRDDPRFQALWG